MCTAVGVEKKASSALQERVISALRYDPRVDRWVEVEPMPTIRGGHGIVLWRGVEQKDLSIFK